MSNQKRVLTAVAITAVLGVGGLAAGIAARAATVKDEANRVAPGVSVASISVGGLTKDEAREKVRTWAKEQLANTVALSTPETGKRFLIALPEAGGRFDVDKAVEDAYSVGKTDNWWTQVWMAGRDRDVNITPDFKLNETVLDKRLAEIANKVHKEPRNAYAKMGKGNVLVVSRPEVVGTKLDIAATKAALLASGVDALKDGEQAELVLVEEQPKITSDILGSVGTLLGSYSTSYGSSSANRRSNIEKATAAINGTLLAPGETFSYNDTVGERSPRLGWLNAPTYQDGQVVPGPGGGICQVSTTLYNATLRANLKIAERHNHSMPVHYVPPGCDATVNYGSLDYKFTNSTEGPVYVMARTVGGKLSFNLYGVAEAHPGAVDVITTGRRATARGFSVSTYRVVKATDGTSKREYLDSSSYRPLSHSTPRRPTVRRVAAKPAAKPATAPTVASATPTSA